MQTGENYVKVHFMRFDFYFLAFRLMSVSQVSLPSLFDIAILQGSILELETATRSITNDIFSLLRRKNVLFENMPRKNVEVGEMVNRYCD